MVEEKIEEKKDTYELVQVPTGQALAIQTPSGEVLNQEQALVEVLNIIKDIKKAVA